MTASMESCSKPLCQPKKTEFFRKTGRKPGTILISIVYSFSKHHGAVFDMDWLWVVGVLAVYFALQLWILPKMGIPT